jgi:hypothetical protein
MTPQEVEISDDTFVITADDALAYKEELKPKTPAEPVPGSLFPASGDIRDGSTATTGGPPKPDAGTTTRGADDLPAVGAERLKLFHWEGEVPPQKWMNFYTKVLSRFATQKGLRLTVRVDVSPEGGVSTQTVQETKAALRELGLTDDMQN